MAEGESGRAWHGELIDAYCHVGVPKYGTVSDAAYFFARLDIQRAVFVLGPGIPDLASLAHARDVLGESVRLMGIPFGATEAERRELGELQIRMGISGMRLMPDELEPNRRLLDRIGEEGLVLYAINPFGAKGQSSEATSFLIDWLERHDSGAVASPHFLRPCRIEDLVDDVGLLRELLVHPRFHAIFSRQGGAHSVQPYPHCDLLPWVEQIADCMTWKRILWGSEFPIIYQRSEQPEQVRDWLQCVGVAVTAGDLADFYANNARRLFFDRPSSSYEAVEVPPWVGAQIDTSQTVYLFPSNLLHIPMRDHATLLSHFMALTETQPNLTYAEYIAERLSDVARRIREEEKDE